jgi:hypothetical protein
VGMLGVLHMGRHLPVPCSRRGRGCAANPAVSLSPSAEQGVVDG